jgi:hypothetical protein
MASMPEPMKPRAKMVDAQDPAKGRRADAACAADAMSGCPCAPSVTAVAAIMANITALERAMPVKTSKRLVRTFSEASRGGRRRRGTARLPPSGSSRISSTRCRLCQKNRYGEMVVPRTATNRDM